MHHPVAIEDPEFDIDLHVHRLAAPAPGGASELDEVIAQISSYPLDRSRPLWDLWMIEGLANGPAMEARWGQRAETLPSDHPAWALEAHYLGLACANFVVTLCPQRIILGGGVMEQRQLFPLIRNKLLAHLNEYIHSPAILSDIDAYIVPPKLGARAGVLGSIALAMQSI